MNKHLISLLTALRFLTIIPLPWLREKDSEYFLASVKYFIFVGVLIGIVASFTCKILLPFIPHPILSVFAILFLASMSGFLHLDGLADTADGFFSARSKEKILVIMHDSRSGAMGVIILIFVLLAKFAALTSLSSENLLTTIFFMPICGRCAIILSMTFLPYAREEGGLGKLFYAEKGWVLPFLAISVFLLSGYFVSLHLTILLLATVVTTTFFFGVWCKKIIGGTTGDTLGAICEITEANAAIVLACLFAN